MKYALYNAEREIVEVKDFAVPPVQDRSGEGYSWEEYSIATVDAAKVLGLLVAALEAHYDGVANQRRYDNRYTCALRAGYVSPFQAEGLAFAQWMDTCNAIAYTVMNECMAGQRELPTGDELVAEMPAMVWP